MRFLVTGATGFVGSYLVDLLVERHGIGAVTAMHHIHLSKQETEKLSKWRQAGVKTVECDLLQFDQNSLPVPLYDVVYHLAAYAETETTGGPFEVNSKGTENLIQWLGMSLKGKQIVYTGTLASVDRDLPVGPATEETPCRPLTAYGKTKLEGEKVVKRLANEYDYDFTICRLCTIVGKGFRAGGMFGVLPELLRKGSFAARLNWPGRASFLCVQDLAAVLAQLPEVRGTRNKVFMLSNGEHCTFDVLFGKIAEILKITRKRISLPVWLWTLLARIAWFGAHQTWLPHKIHITCWRFGHLTTDGILADASQINAVLKMQYAPLTTCLRKAYDKTESGRAEGH